MGRAKGEEGVKGGVRERGKGEERGERGGVQEGGKGGSVSGPGRGTRRVKRREVT